MNTCTTLLIRSGLSAAVSGLSAAVAMSLFSCMRPPANPPGVEQQPVMHPERSLATQHTVPQDPSAIPAAESPDDPDSLGTTRTPPAAPAQPLDLPDDTVSGNALDAGVTR